MVAAHVDGPQEVHAFEPDHARRFALRLNLLRAPREKRYFVRLDFLGAAGSRDLTLDRYCRQQRVAPDLIKMDIEGAEIDVLVGAREICLRHGPTLLIEYHERRLRRQGRDPAQLLSLLSTYGYRVRFNGHHGALESGDRTPDLEWRDAAPNPHLTAILATSTEREVKDQSADR